MIDHLLVFASQEDADAAFPPIAGRDGQPVRTPSWRIGGRTVMPIRIVVSPAAYDADGAEIAPEVLAPGVWLALRTEERDAALEALPNCMSCTDSALAEAGQPYIHFHRWPPETVLGQVVPVFAGDSYPIPAGQPASALAAWMIA